MENDSLKENELLEEIYYKYNQQIYYLAYKYLRDEDLAEDIVHDTMIEIRKKIIKKEIVSCHKLGVLIGLIVRGLSVNYIKRNNRIVYREILDFENKIEDYIINDVIVNEIINEVPTKYRKIFVMRFIMEISYKEISKETGIKEATLRKQIERTKSILAKKYAGSEHFEKQYYR